MFDLVGIYPSDPMDCTYFFRSTLSQSSFTFAQDAIAFFAFGRSFLNSSHNLAEALQAACVFRLALAFLMLGFGLFSDDFGVFGDRVDFGDLAFVVFFVE
jgi:hypothetical protein